MKKAELRDSEQGSERC